MIHASVSLYVSDVENGDVLADYNSGKSFTPASIMKLITSATAIELLGPDHTFKTTIGYTGSLNSRSGKLKGDIIIKGGGDPSLGSTYFTDHYKDFINNWIVEIKKAGIRKIEGRVLTDDSYFDYLPVHAKWLWEDPGSYYGAGVYGLSVFDNSYEIHIKSLSGNSKPEITKMVPPECKYEYRNLMVTGGNDYTAYAFAEPYSTKGWIAGSVPKNTEDYAMKVSIADPPLLLSKIVTKRLEEEGIKVSEEPVTTRDKTEYLLKNTTPVTETTSPSLADIVKVLNHESVNLYAEHITKELGKVFKNNGSTSAGVEVIMNFLNNAGIDTGGMFIVDGSGLSPQNSINSKELVKLLIYMQKNGKYFHEYISSLPEAGKDGTLKNCFMDPVFDSTLRVKSGSMTRVRSYAGYFTTMMGKKAAFSIIVNDFSGPSSKVVSLIEEFVKEMILTK